MELLSKTSASPMSYLKIFFRKKFYFFIPLYAGLLIGICAAILLPKEYKSSTIILVEEGKTDNPLFNKIAVSTTVQQRLATIRESMLGWNSIVTLVKRLNLDKDINSTYDFEQLVLEIRGNIRIKMRGPNIIDLTYTGKERESTQAIVKNIADILIERNVQIQNKETADAIKFIEDQLHVYKGKIKSAEIAKLKDQLDQLLIDSTEKHPLVKQLREQINAQRKALREENLDYTESSSLRMQSTQPIIAEIKKALDQVETSTLASPTSAPTIETGVAKVMLIDKLDNIMARDVNVNNKIYNMLLQRLETAKITQRLQSSKEGTRYTILDPPRLPLKPSSPNLPLLTFMGLFLGGVSGAGLVIATEFLDKSFLDVEDAKDYLGMPLLGAISKITTLESIRDEKEHTRWIFGLTFLSGIILIVIVYALSTFLK